jgi:flagellar biosynthesis protein FlhF
VEPSFGPRQQAEQLIREHETNGDSSKHTYNRPRSGNSNTDKTDTRERQPETTSENGHNGTNGEKNNPVSTEKLTRVLENTDRLTEKIDELASSLDDESTITDGGGENFPGKLTPVYQELVDNGVEPEIARDLIGRVRRQLEADELDQIDEIKSKMKDEISSDIPVADPLQVDRDETLLLPFVGSTGVGKTTTMAKLAAHFSVEEGLDVSFITFDTYRLAAVEQLRCYADILQVPVEAVMSEEEFEETLEEFKTSSDIVFIDTAGRSQFDEDKIKELEGMIETEESVITHLVVDSTSRPDDLDSILRGFEPIGYDRIVVTKLDETRHHGTLLNLSRRADPPISYVTDGQDVPDDLSRLDSDEIASLIVGEDVESLNTHSASEPSGVRD